MTKNKQTSNDDEDFEEFKSLYNLSGSRNQMDRIISRMDMPKFVKKHGVEKCDEFMKRIPDAE